jgi:hypothetical protein
MTGLSWVCHYRIAGSYPAVSDLCKVVSFRFLPEMREEACSRVCVLPIWTQRVSMFWGMEAYPRQENGPIPQPRRIPGDTTHSPDRLTGGSRTGLICRRESSNAGDRARAYTRRSRHV